MGLIDISPTGNGLTIICYFYTLLFVQRTSTTREKLLQPMKMQVKYLSVSTVLYEVLHTVLKLDLNIIFKSMR